MKRIKYACLEQTPHFMLKEDIGHEEAVQAVQNELVLYKKRLEQSRAKYRILGEETQADGSVVVKVKKQYNHHDCGPYLQ